MIESGVLNGPSFEGLCKEVGGRLAIITDANVAKLYGSALYEQLQRWGVEAEVFSFPAGEAHKTRQIKAILEDQLLDKGYGRDTCILALGGGVTTDLGGYLAATYCRGVPLILMPTSLLAMVDASLGGKTGVNTPFGKNLIGAFYHPQAVLIDPTFLHTLPSKEIKNGLVEMIKHGLIADINYVNFLKEQAPALLRLDKEIMQNAIFMSCQIKQQIIQVDEKEQGKRHLLNFGHTMGHALETKTHYQLSHGEAVALGIIAESRLAVIKGQLSLCAFEEILALLKLYEIKPAFPAYLTSQEIWKEMYLDKKSIRNQPRFVLLQGIGKSYTQGQHYCFPVSEAEVLETLNWMNHNLYCY